MNARPDFALPLTTGTPVHDATLLVGPERTGHIVLNGQVYTLRITRAGKLILTK